MQSFPYTDQLLQTDPFDFSTKNKNLFVESFKEMAFHHYSQCDFFRAFWDYKKFHPSNIKNETDLTHVPYMMVHLFKENEWWSGSKEDIVLTLGSSGTNGQKSLMHLDQGSLDRVKLLAFNVHESLGMTNSKRYNYLCFTYDPKIAKDLGTAFTDELLTQFTGHAEIYYAFKWSSIKNDFELDKSAVVETLKRFEADSLPTRILGFPAFLYKIIQEFNLKLKLGSESWVQTGGGWKTLSEQEIPKSDFRTLVSESLGIPKQNIRDLFGMVEHGIPYVDSAQGQLTIPNYGRVFIRCPYTLKLLPHGKKGLIQFMCSYNSKYPSVNILSHDWGRVIIDEKNPDQKLLVIEGRAGKNKLQGCALKALDLL